jgi:hypothetical protein
LFNSLLANDEAYRGGKDPLVAVRTGVDTVMVGGGMVGRLIEIIRETGSGTKTAFMLGEQAEEPPLTESERP